MKLDLHEENSIERKALQDQGKIPQWMSTQGWQLFKEKYTNERDRTFLDRASVIARTAAQYTNNPALWERNFFGLIWKGWLSCSTPVLSNMGTSKGMAVSCSGGYVDDSIDGFYQSRYETAILTKNGFGTSAYLGDIRSRGSRISVGGVASGILPVLKGFVQDSQDVTQGTQRRGAWAGYIPIDHGDFYEINTELLNHGDDLNIGWTVSDAFIKRLNSGDAEAINRYQLALKTKMVTGKGYFSFPDKVNRHAPESYKAKGLEFKASNLCNEISLFSDEDHTFTCVLSSLNLAKLDEWEEDFDEVVSTAIRFLDCVAEDFIQKGSRVKGLENAVRFTQKSRALGLGVCGWHTLLQNRKIPWETMEAGYLNDSIFRRIRASAEAASKDLAEENGPTEWANDGYRNSHLLAIAPTKSTALIMGGVSEGINPDPAMIYTQLTAGGDMARINPVLLKLMKDRDVYDKRHISEVIDAQGSVQKVDWLSDEEKKVFKTAYEIDQHQVLRHARIRSKYLDQWQSLNLFFFGSDTEDYVSSVHQSAFNDEAIRGLYYCYGSADVSASRGECEVCQ